MTARYSFSRNFCSPPWRESVSTQKPGKDFSLDRGTSPACTSSHSTNERNPGRRFYSGGGLAVAQNTFGDPKETTTTLAPAFETSSKEASSEAMCWRHGPWKRLFEKIRMLSRDLIQRSGGGRGGGISVARQSFHPRLGQGLS